MPNKCTKNTMFSWLKVFFIFICFVTTLSTPSRAETYFFIGRAQSADVWVASQLHIIVFANICCAKVVLAASDSSTLENRFLENTCFLWTKTRLQSGRDQSIVSDTVFVLLNSYNAGPRSENMTTTSTRRINMPF